MNVRPGQTFETVLTGAPPNLTGTLAVSIQDGSTVLVAEHTTGIIEFPDDSGIYVATLTDPDDAGEYQVVWRNGSTYVADPLTVTYDATVPTGTEDGNLVSVAEARAYLDVDDTKKPTTTWLNLTIGGISAEVMRYTGRVYIPRAGSPSARVFRWTGETVFNVPDHTDLSQVRVAADPDDGPWTTLPGSAWTEEPLDQDVRNRLRLLGDTNVLPQTGIGWFAWGDARTRSEWPREAAASISREAFLELTAIWGWPAVPQNVKLAVCRWLRAVVREDVAFYSRDLGDTQADAGGKRNIVPQDVKDILDGQQSAGTPRVRAV